MKLRSMSIQSFFRECLSLPYKPNSQDNSEHEPQVKDLLEKHGIKYKYQPNGPQNFPDFSVMVKPDKWIDLECKSSKQAYPTYNGGLPHKGSVYIFVSAKYNETTLFFADDVVSEKKRAQYERLVEDLNAVVKTYQLDEEWQEDDRGFDFYMRAMYTQSGGKDKKDYFTHAQRNRCESNVLNHNWELS